MTSDLVANVHPAAADPQPATGSDRHIAEAVAPVAVPPVAVMTATHATTLAPTTTLAPASSGSFGGDERGGADSGDGGDSENRLADHGSLLGCYRMCSHILPDPSRERSVGFDSASICESQIAHFVMAITFAEAIAWHVAPIDRLEQPHVDYVEFVTDVMGIGSLSISLGAAIALLRQSRWEAAHEIRCREW